MTIKLLPWDWHYRIGFDSELGNDIRIKAQSLPAQYRDTLLAEAAAYASLVSVSALIDAIADNPIAAESYIHAGQRCQVTYLPQVRVAEYLSRIDSINGISIAAAQGLREVVNRATSCEFVNQHRAMFEPAFGHTLHKLLDGSSPLNHSVPSPRVVSKFSARDQVEYLIRINQPFLQNQYQSFYEPNFNIEERIGDETT